MAQAERALRLLTKRQWQKRIESIGDSDGHVRGYHGGCPSAEPGFRGSSYAALFLDEYGRICCNECGAVDLGRAAGARFGGGSNGSS